MNEAGIIDLLSSLSWREPLWLFLAGVPLLRSWLLPVLRLIQGQRQARYADPQLLPWVATQRPLSMRRTLFSKNGAYVVAWLLFAIAASGPRVPLILPGDVPAVQRNIMLLVDVSRSMRISDTRPTRLQRARIEIDELLQHARQARIGIILFAARAHLYVPLTTDFAALRGYLQNLDNVPLPTEGSRPAAALQMASAELQGLKEPSAMVMLSDGDFAQALSATGAVDARLSATDGDAAPHNIPIYALGLGSSEGEAIPLQDGDWLRYQGQPVISRLNEDALRQLIARHGHTSAADAALHYSPARDDAGDWLRLYDQGIAKLSRGHEKVAEPGHHHWRQLYPWALLPAIVLLWLALLPWRMKPLRGLPHTLVILGLGLLLLLPPPIAQAAAVETAGGRPSVDIEGAYRQYTAGHFAVAIQRYKQIPGYDGRLGEGASRYKNGDFHGAVAQFSRATLLADSEEKRSVALFNLGNSYFQIGNYPSAIDSFRDALLYNPQSKAAQHNLAFSRALKKAVDKQRQRAERMGTGPQLAPARNDIGAQESSSMAIDESESVAEDVLPLPELADLSDVALQVLIDKGLTQIRLAASATSTQNAGEQQKTKLALINARLRMLQLQDQQALLWKRLFEMEEGFPAPLDAPRTVPGVAPW